MDKEKERILNISINFASRCFYYYFLSIKTLDNLTVNYTNQIEKGKDQIGVTTDTHYM